MSIRETVWAINQECVNPLQKFVLMAIADNADGDGKSLCRVTSIEKFTNLSEPDILGIVGELAVLGLLIKHPGDMYLLECGPSQPIGCASYSKKKISNSMRLRVFQRDGMVCLRCGCDDVVKLRADHVIPESKGGPTTLDNLQSLCVPCNSWKGVKAIDFREIRAAGGVQ